MANIRGTCNKDDINILARSCACARVCVYACACVCACVCACARVCMDRERGVCSFFTSALGLVLFQISVKKA